MIETSCLACRSQWADAEDAGFVQGVMAVVYSKSDECFEGMLSASSSLDAASERMESHVESQLAAVLGSQREAHGSREMLEECRVGSKVVAASNLLLQELMVARLVRQRVSAA